MGYSGFEMDDAGLAIEFEGDGPMFPFGGL